MKRSKLLFVIAIVAILAVMFVACDDGSGQTPHEHSYGGWTITQQPTLDAPGTATKECSSCDDVQTETVAKLSDASVWTVDPQQSSTHESAGFAVYTSKYGVVTLTFPKGEHVYGAWSIIADPTDTEKGKAMRECACGHFESVEIAALSDATVWTKDEESSVAASHSAPGKDVFTSEYGTVEVVIAQQPHEYGTIAHDNGDGTHYYACTGDGCTEKKYAAHVFDQKNTDVAYLVTPASCGQQAVYAYSCVCGLKDPDAEHTFTFGAAGTHNYVFVEVETEATCTEKGSVKVRCSLCGDESTQEIAALGHDFHGDCIPYEYNPYGESEYDYSYDGSEYHVVTCTRCGAVDSANKEAHELGDPTYELVESTPGYHSVYVKTTCDKCGYTNTDGDAFQGFVESTAFWTFVESHEADYTSNGWVKYIYKSTGVTYTFKTSDKLTAPYANKTYSVYEVYVRDGAYGPNATYDWNYSITFDANGVGTGTGAYIKGTNTITIADALTGKIEYKRVDGDKTTVYEGYVDFESGIFFRTKSGSYDNLLMFVPSDFAVNYSSLEGSNWFNAMTIAYSADCSLGETHYFTVAVYDEVIYFGAKFVDEAGNDVAAGDCYNANYVRFVKGTETIAAFAKNAEGALIETDGKEGTYTTPYSDTFKFDGIGGLTFNGTTAGTYALVDGSENVYHVYLLDGEGNATRYYVLTLGEDYACTAEIPMATLTFTTAYGSADNMDVNVNIPANLPELVQEAYVLKGWTLEGTDTPVKTFTATESTSYNFTAVWGDKCAVTVSGLLADDVTTYSSFYIAVGDKFIDALPAYTVDTINEGYYFSGWFFDANGNGIVDEDEESLDPGTEVIDGQTSATILAQWTWAGNVTFTAQSGYTFVYDYANGYWASNNQGAHSTSATMRFAVTTGKAVVSLEYYCNSESSDILTIYYGPDWKKVSMGGTSNSWKTLTTTITYDPESSNQQIYIYYKKDSGGNNGDDTAYIRNLRINGVLVTAQSSLNKDVAGTYTASDSTQVIVGMGGALQIGENFYGYTVLDENTISATIEGTYKEITLDKSAGTCTIVVPQVNVTYHYNGHGGTDNTVAVNKNSTYALITDLTETGYVFRGWYTDEALTQKADATCTPTTDLEFYAKWDEAVTLTFDYNGQGTEATVITSKYVGDTIGAELPSVSVTKGEQVFVGWFSLNGSETGEWGEEATADTVISASATYYAKWLTPHAMMGSYSYGANLDPSESGIVNESDTLSSGTYKFAVDALGNVTGWKAGTIEDYDPATGTFYILSGTSKYYGGFNKYAMVMFAEYSANKTTAYHDTVFGAAQKAESNPASTLNVAWDNGITKFVCITYADDTTQYILIKDRIVYLVSSWTAYDKDGASVEHNQISASATILNLVCVDNGNVTHNFAFGKVGTNFVLCDDIVGTYTNGSDTIVLDGFGGITMGEKSGTYAKTKDNASVLDVYLENNTEYYEVTIDVEAKTFTATQPTVNVTYNYNGHGGTDNSVAVNKNVTYTLVTATEEGYIFRGWYTDEALTQKASATYTPSADLTFYAKWDAAVTLTFDYNGQGTAAVVVSDKYVGDKVSGIPTVTVTKGEQVFAGWFSLNGSETGEWGEEASTSTVLTGDTTYYAKWITPVKSYGTYKGFEIWSAASGKTASDLTKTILTMNANGTYSGISSISGTLSNEDALVENGAINLTRYAYVTSAFGGIVILGYSSSATSVGSDFYIGFKNSANITSVDYSAVSLSGTYTAWLTVSYKEGATSSKMGILVYNNVIYANVTWKSNGIDVEAKECASTDKLVIYNSEGQPMFAKDGSSIVGNDGKAGSYESSGAYGTIVLDGFGTLTIGDDSTSYTIEGNVVSFTLNNAMRKVTLGEGTYTKTLDGYEGTYTLPDGTSTIVLDGYGNADSTKTYVVNGATITIYDGETSTAYGIDVANKLFLGKSKFAGYTFTKSSVHYVTFDDSSSISGKLVCGYSSWYVMFDNGVLEGNTLTVTITSQVGTGATVGATIVFNVSGDTIEITSGSFPNVDTAVGYSYTCDGFSL
ncbi:MAG: InlB B-repeat-containing protein [Christensenellales bacterium]